MIDINCDMGESFGDYTIGKDEEVIRYITSSNIACGFHASDPVVMEKTVRLCKEHNVTAGAHPGYPDLMGFGRRHIEVAESDLMQYIIYQTGALKGFLDFHNMALQHVKPHGALYNRLVVEEDLFVRIARALNGAFGDIILLTLGTKKTSARKKRLLQEGIRVALEAFPDRAYTDEGELLPRKHEGAVLKDPRLIAQRAVKMVKEGGTESVNGVWISMDIDTLCIHGDNDESIEAVKLIHDHCAREGIEIRPLHAIL